MFQRLFHHPNPSPYFVKGSVPTLGNSNYWDGDSIKTRSDSVATEACYTFEATENRLLTPPHTGRPSGVSTAH